MSNEPNNATCYLFDPEQGYIYAAMKLRSTLEPQHVGPDEWVTVGDKLTIESLQAAGTVSKAAVRCSLDEACTLANEAARRRYCSGPERVTRERWWELFEVLPPERWETCPQDCEVFMMPECISGRIYTFGVRMGDNYLTINEDCSIKTLDLLVICSSFLANENR